MDSTEETIRHIVRVKEFMNMVAMELARRGAEHDRSKLNEPEKSIFDEMTPKLKTSTYGSEEYKGFLREMKVALDHHYENNRHHPEHSEKGIEGGFTVFRFFDDFHNIIFDHVLIAILYFRDLTVAPLS